MKIFLVLAFVCAASAAAVFTEADSERLSQAFKRELYARLGQEERNDVIPPFNETQPINDTRLEFNDETLIGFVELIGATAYDLHTLIDDIKFNLITLKATGHVTCEKARIAGEYATDLLIHLPFVEPPFTNETIASGKGKGDLSLAGLLLDFNCNIIPNFITDRVVLTKLVIDISITDLKLFLENLVVDGSLVNWDEVNQDALAWFNKLVETHKEVLQTFIQKAINTILADIKLSDIIGAIGSK